MMRRRSVLLSMIAAAAVALVLLSGHFAGSYAAFSEQKTLTGDVSSGYWLATITIKKAVATDDAFTFVADNVPGCDTDKTLANTETFSCTYNAIGGDDDYAISETLLPAGWTPQSSAPAQATAA